MSRSFYETLVEQMRGPKFKAEWDALAPERQIMWATIEEREDRNSAQYFTESPTLSMPTSVGWRTTPKQP